MRSVLKEICISEAGKHSEHKLKHPSQPFANHKLFYAATPRVPQTHEKPKKDPVCAFCKGTHRINSCTLVKCAKKRLAIVKSAGLCFNCLVHQKMSQCPSKFTAVKKHHTSLSTTNIEPPPQTPSSQVINKADQTVPTTHQMVTTAAQTVTATTHSAEPPITVTITSLSALPTRVCLLKTAITNISTGQTTVEGHILFERVPSAPLSHRNLLTSYSSSQIVMEIFVSSFGEQVLASKNHSQD